MAFKMGKGERKDIKGVRDSIKLVKSVLSVLELPMDSKDCWSCNTRGNELKRYWVIFRSGDT